MLRTSVAMEGARDAAVVSALSALVPSALVSAVAGAQFSVKLEAAVASPVPAARSQGCGGGRELSHKRFPPGPTKGSGT